jgi:hypothetical protein
MSAKSQQETKQEETLLAKPLTEVFKGLTFYVEVFNSNLDQSEHITEVLLANSAKVSILT